MENLNTHIKIFNNEETIRKIHEGCSICRYGDGEFSIILGGRTRLQPGDINLVSRLKEILKDNNSNILIAIPEAFNGNYEKYTNNASNFWKDYNSKNLEDIKKFLDCNKEYYSSQITWFYTDVKDKSRCDEYVKEIKKIWQNKEVLIVEGIQTRMGMDNDLFQNAKSIKRILCPSENAYSKYSEILTTCLKQKKDCLIIIALGATATVLAYDLGLRGYQALDFGHIDLEYEWYLRKANEKVKIKNKFENEINDCKNIDMNYNKDYEKSIIKIIN